MHWSSPRLRRRLPLAVAISFAALLALASITAIALQAKPLAPPAASAQAPGLDLVFVTEDYAAMPTDQRHVGCDALSVFAADLSWRPLRGVTQYSPGRIAVNADMTVALATPSNWRRFLYTFSRDGADDKSWRTGRILDPSYAIQGGITFLPDGRTYLVAVESSGTGTMGGEMFLKNKAPYVVRKYKLPSTLAGDRKPGRLLGSFRTDGVAVEVVASPDGTTAHLVTHNAVIHTIDVSAMTESAPPIHMAPVGGPRNGLHPSSQNATHATLTEDGRYLVTNRWDEGEINVADLQTRQTWTLAVSSDHAFTGGVAVNRGWINSGLLAVHAGEDVVTYEFRPHGPLTELGRVPVTGPDPRSPGHQEGGPLLSIAWSGLGSRIIAAADRGSDEFVVISADNGGRDLEVDGHVEVCDRGYNAANDIWTANGLITPPVTPTANASPTPTWTRPPPTATASTTATPTVSPVATASVTPVFTATATSAPKPLYLPIALREICDPEYQRSDIALVIDTSSSMTGRKIVDARGAALAFTEMIDLEPGRNQLAVVRFDRESEVVRELTRARTTLEAGIRGLRTRSGTHIDKGLRAGLAELQSPRHIERNTQVLVLLTDGVQTGTPGEELKAAAEVRQAGVRVYAIGLGGDADTSTLLQIAGADERYYFAPNSADLSRIYSEIAVDLMCPGTWADP